MVRNCNVCGQFISDEESVILLKTRIARNTLLREWCSEECYKKDNKVRRC